MLCKFGVFGETRRRLKNAHFRDMTPYGSCKNRRFGGIYRLHHQGGNSQRTRNNVSVTANVVPSSQIIFTLIMVIHSSETSVHITAIWYNIPEDVIVHSDHSEYLKPYREGCRRNVCKVILFYFILQKTRKHFIIIDRTPSVHLTHPFRQMFK
jgi:hypothetical protein